MLIYLPGELVLSFNDKGEDDNVHKKIIDELKDCNDAMLIGAHLFTKQERTQPTPFKKSSSKLVNVGQSSAIFW